MASSSPPTSSLVVVRGHHPLFRAFVRSDFEPLVMIVLNLGRVGVWLFKPVAANIVLLEG